jgi:hypothetical protein
VRAICMLRSMWRGLETESRSGLHGHERGNPGHRQGHDLKDHRASPRPYHLSVPKTHPCCFSGRFEVEALQLRRP